jgi:two-component system, LytTR family, response regulator
MTMKVIAVDDEPLARERVAALVQGTQGLELVGEAGNGLEALDLITTLSPDLVFIDVEMPELSGFGVVTALRGERVPAIVLVTAYDKYAMQAFEVGVLDYLQKPVTPQRFAAAVERARAQIQRHSSERTEALLANAAEIERARGARSRFVVRRGNTHHFVPVDQIDWIDVADNYLQLHTGARAHLYRGTMKEIEAELDPQHFVRIHRCVMVAVDRIAAIHTQDIGGYLVELKDGTQLRSSRAYSPRIRSLLR